MGRDARSGARSARMHATDSWRFPPARPTAPSRFVLRRTLFGLALAAMGVVNLLSALLSRPPDRLRALRHLLPTDVLDTSRTFTLLAGALLLVTAWGLQQGKRRAYVIGLFLCALSVPVNLFKAFDVEEATLATALMFALGVSADAFRVRSRALRFAVLRAEFLAAAAVLGLYVVGGTWLLEREFGHHLSLAKTFADAGYRMFGIGQPVEAIPATLPLHARPIARWFAHSLPLLSLVLVAGGALASLGPALHRRRHQRDREWVRGLLRRYGDSTIASFALDTDVDYFFSSNRRAVLAYRHQSGTLLAIGDPIGPHEEHAPLLAAFRRYCEEGGWAFAIFQARPEYLPLYRALGWTALHLGEDPVLWTGRFTLEGAAAGEVRRAVRRCERLGITVRHFRPDERALGSGEGDAALFRELTQVSEEWLEGRPGGEKGFCMGAFGARRLASSWLAVAWNADRGRVEAFVTWEPVWARRGWAIDLMRRRRDSPAGVMELLVARSVEAARERGDEMLSLSLSALATAEAGAGAARGASGEPDVSGLSGAEYRAYAFLRRHLCRFYDFDGLFRWKRKFDPACEPRYLVLPSRLSLPRVALALVRAQSPQGLRAYWNALWARPGRIRPRRAADPADSGILAWSAAGEPAPRPSSLP